MHENRISINNKKKGACQMFEIRTDLAVEERERIQKKNKNIRGVSVDEEYFEAEDIRIITVQIKSENGAKEMGKPKGTYITLEAADMGAEDEDYHRQISEKLAGIIKRLMPQKKDLSVLVAGLGNRMVTPDALGPQVADNLCITRHIIREFGKSAYQNEEVQRISAIVPGVMAQTGMESREIIAGVISEVNPDCLIVIDALAARSARRLGRTIQITDTGINPGSGVGNHRHSITKETIGIPVIAIGIPTVVEAATIVQDSMSALIDELSENEAIKPLKHSWDKLNEAEHKDLIRELLSPQLNNMFVTPKDIDAAIKQMSYTVSEGINIAFCGERKS
jgi:spore protease